MILKEHAELQNLLVERLVAVYQPKAIYLFGSQAWGEPTEDSDVDIYIVIESSTEESLAARIYSGAMAVSDLRIDIDLLVFTEAEISERIAHPATLEHKIWTKGKKLYEAA